MGAVRQFALLVITDGRARYMARAIESLRASLRPWPQRCFVADDSGEVGYRRQLHEALSDFVVISDGVRQGMARNIELGWKGILAHTDVEYVFHTEDDFVFNDYIPLEEMAWVMDDNPHLAQLTLKREPVSPEEIAAGGMLEVAPELYADREGYVEHRKLFSCNPSLVRVEALRVALAGDCASSSGGIERGVTDVLLAADYSFGYWGRREDPPLCAHIGVHRSPEYRW